MPEGDTLFRIRQALSPVLTGKSAFATLPQRGFEREPVDIARVDVHGKNLFIVFADGRVLYTHLRMRGLWHVYKTSQPWRRSKATATVILETDAHVAVCFQAPSAVVLSRLQARRFMATFAASSDILSDSFDAGGAAQRLIAQGETPVAIALLNQEVLAGIGNVYKSETLFACSTHPETLCVSLSELVATRVVLTAQAMMRANVTSVSLGSPSAHYSYQRITRSTKAGCEVGKGPIAVYGRMGRDCYTCGTTIDMIRQGPLLRSSYYCPACQKR
jgi:endonuclease VIII